MKLKEVIVVEGKHDTQTLQQFFNVDTIETNGLHLSKERIAYIQKLHEKRGVILFLDPDSAGTKIRQRLNAILPDAKNAFMDKHKCRTSKKVGIEHANKEDLQAALQHVITYDEHIKNTLEYNDYISLGFQGRADSKALRRKVGNLLFLGECNSKTLYKRLNMYQIEKAELTRLVEDLHE